MNHIGAWEGTRTPDLRITNALLYQLSYPGNPWSEALSPYSVPIL
jgi:hypothetical protein